MPVSKNRRFAKIANDVNTSGTLTAAAISSDVNLGGATTYDSAGAFPSSGTGGDLAYATSTGALWMYDAANSRWEVITSSPPTYSVEALLVGAGGQGAAGGGGGAGGLLYYGDGSNNNGAALDIPYGTTFTVVVGQPGDGPAPVYPAGGVNGGNTTFAGGTINLVSYGGGGGAGGAYVNGSDANSGYYGAAGGSGGGGGGNNSITNATMPGGTSVSGQGNDGGSGYATSGSPAGGGGGAGGAGGNHSSKTGGVGLAMTYIVPVSVASAENIGEISGSDVYFAGGGGGGSHSSGSGAGGLGGGGDGSTHTTSPSAAVNALDNTGGGGGGGSGFKSTGGSGVAVFKVPVNATINGTNYTTASVTGGTLVIFKQNGTLTLS